MPHGPRTAGARTPRRLGFFLLALTAGCQTGGKYLPPTKPLKPVVNTPSSTPAPVPQPASALPPTVQPYRPTPPPVVTGEGFGAAKMPDHANPNSGNFTTPSVPGIPTSGGSLMPANLAPPTPVPEMKPADIAPPTASSAPMPALTQPTLTPPTLMPLDPPAISK